jgi:hypothetical protein
MWSVYIGITENEMVDSIAKDGVNKWLLLLQCCTGVFLLNLTFCPNGRQMVSRRDGQVYLLIPSRMQLNPSELKVDRPCITVVSRLMLNHTWLRAHLRQSRRRCGCVENYEPVDHILWGCSLYYIISLGTRDMLVLHIWTIVICWNELWILDLTFLYVKKLFFLMNGMVWPCVNFTKLLFESESK